MQKDKPLKEQNCPDNYKNSNNTGTPSRVAELMHMRSVLRKKARVISPMNVTISGQKIDFVT